MIYQRLILLLILTLLSACAKKSNTIPPKEHYTSRINDQGKLEFAYGLSWIPEAVPRRPGQRNTPSRLQGDISLNSLPATSEWKLRMEELAVKQLEQKFLDEFICIDGYTIDDIAWARDRVRLLGTCK